MLHLKWTEGPETVMSGVASGWVDEQLAATSNTVPCTIYAVPEAWYTAGFMVLYDLLYGPNAPVNAKFPRLKLSVDGAEQPGSTMAVLGTHRLWVRGEPAFDGCFFFHFPLFYELKANLLDLQIGMGLMVKKHLALLP